MFVYKVLEKGAGDIIDNGKINFKTTQYDYLMANKILATNN